jgi:fructose 1,6-bisphosphatase
MGKGFKFVIMDVECGRGERVIELKAPQELYDIAALLRDPERYVVAIGLVARRSGSGSRVGRHTPAQRRRRLNWRVDRGRRQLRTAVLD